MFGKKDNDKPICPLVKGECLKAGCTFWTNIQGQHPQTGAQMDMPDCAIKWLPVLLIENSKETRQAAAAVETLRNENVTTGQQITGALMQVASANSQQLLKGS
ncbi:MAG: hypothetical protein B7X95_01365 [Methylophilaceae bacterium 17-44-8]|nr:MAG: hypothetical protein B7X95_01365 [Methylophilaceae bacterium 17-44-8]